MPAHPKAELEKRRSLQDKVADGITAFSGSMAFVYVHLVIFIVWIASSAGGLDPYPFQFLTMAVSLEAIFLSTFVMISQNRQAQEADVRAELDYQVNLKAESEIEDIQKDLEEIKRLLKKA